MPGRNLQGDYRYGYQGQFAEKDNETGLNAFELRMYDSRIMRWLSPDPYGQFDSPYLSMGNNWISYIDEDGGECCNGWKKDSEGNNVLNEVTVTAGNGSWTSEVNSRYAYSGTFSMWQQEFDRSGSYLQELQNWEAEHGETFRQLTVQWDKEEQNRKTLEKLAFFSGGFGTIGQVVSPGSLPTARPFGFKGVVGRPNLNTLSPFKLEATHAITKSKSQFQELLTEIKVKGKVTETVKYVNHSGRRYIVDGHHRSYIAKRLGYDVPVEEVSLPYGNYRNASDLIYEGSNPGYLNYIKY